MSQDTLTLPQAVPAVFDKETAILKYLPQVKKLAQQIAATHPPQVSFDDLYSEGALAMVESANRYEPNRGVKFFQFAFKRIHGAMISLYRDQSLYKEVQDLDNSDDPTLSLIDMYADPSTLQNNTNWLLHDIWEHVDLLDERARDIMRMFYLEGQKQQTIGDKYNLSNSRVCQILSESIETLRKNLGIQLKNPAVTQPETVIPPTWHSWLSQHRNKRNEKKSQAHRFRRRRIPRSIPYLLCLVPAAPARKKYKISSGY